MAGPKKVEEYIMLVTKFRNRGRSCHKLPHGILMVWQLLFFLKDPNGTNIDEIEHAFLQNHLVNYLIGWHVVDIWHAKTMKA